MKSFDLSPSFGHFNRFVVATGILITAPAWAQNLPDAPGKTETVKVCSQCHEIARAVSLHQDRAGWQTTMDKMISLGAKGTPEEFEAIFNYLSKNFPAEEIPKIHINTARAIELEAGLNLRRSQAAALIAYRTKHGNFSSIEDLKKIPGFNFSQVEAKKDRLVFD
jgi:competence protein ComEA